MKKSVLLIVFISIMTITLSVNAQEPEPDLKMKILSEKPFKNKDAQILIFYTTSGTISKDSIVLKGRKIIHFKPIEISIDTLLDTISINSNYLQNEKEILDAYYWPGKTFILTNNLDNTEKNWLGFWVENTIQTDTTKFVYQKLNKKIIVSQKKETIIKNYLNYWLIGVWIIFILITLFTIIMVKLEEKLDEKLEEKTVKTPVPIIIPKWKIYLNNITLLIWIIALLSIVFSKSILILLIIILLFFLWLFFWPKK